MEVTIDNSFSVNLSQLGSIHGNKTIIACTFVTHCFTFIRLGSGVLRKYCLCLVPHPSVRELQMKVRSTPPKCSWFNQSSSSASSFCASIMQSQLSRLSTLKQRLNLLKITVDARFSLAVFPLLC